MTEFVQQKLRSPWVALTLLITAIVVGYSFTVFSDQEALAASAVCPATCDDEHCPHHQK